jgi:DNA-binding response OmpR family regulator
MKILLSVGDESARKALREAAVAEGFEVLEALAAAETAAACREFTPELAVISWDQRDARQLAAQLRALPGRPAAQILVHTPSDVTDIDTALADADDILDLPMAHAVLRARLRRAAAAWTRRRDNDVTHLQEKLRDVSRIRHNVNNLLFVVTGNIEWLQASQNLASPDARDCLSDAYDSIQKLNSVLKELSDPRPQAQQAVEGGA